MSGMGEPEDIKLNRYDFFRYTIEWHNLSLSIQKLLLFIMQGNYSAVLNFYGIWVPTFEKLSTVRNIFVRIQITNSNYLGPTLCYCIPLKSSDNCSTLADHTKT
ncbi:hypothetical protein E2986_10854 [Frieseomelitta varia]|uniref:Uncharacterized protein n=1 Tax=Frieseomelitta varia TaxID=561572 RepID=A0A833R7L5_9HYME|nr:hypothetical protein E2986_10854 [Frieseomelitta varia]